MLSVPCLSSYIEFFLFLHYVASPRALPLQHYSSQVENYSSAGPQGQKVLKLFLRLCSLLGYMVRAEEPLMETKVHSLTILGTLSLFHRYICICVHENFQENVIHQATVYLECITLPTGICCVKAILSLVEV